jgi:hypothetical protein
VGFLALPINIPMKCLLEITSAVLRLYPDDAAYGEPFELALFVVGDEGVATLKGLRSDGQLTTEDRKAFFECLRSHGFIEVKWKRYKKNGTKTIRFKL